MANRKIYGSHHKQYGRKIGPTGRKRDEFGVFALNKQGHEINKAIRGSKMYEAWGQEGVREAKQTVHRRFPHRWVKFKTYNQTRFTRSIEKKRAERKK